MRVDRGLLYTGVFLLAIGVALVAADVAALSTTTLIDALRLWPLAVIAIGVGLVLRRTSFSLQGGLLAAALPGIVLGAAMATAGAYATECGLRPNAPSREVVRRVVLSYVDDHHVDVNFDTVGFDPTGGCK